MLKSEKEAYQLWKGDQIAIKDYKNFASACRDAIRKAKTQLELKLSRDIKKVFFRYVSRKQEHWEDIGPLLNRAGKLVTNNADKGGVLSIFCASVFTSVAGSQMAGSSNSDHKRIDPLVREEGVGRGLLQGLKQHKPVGSDKIYHWVLKKWLTVARPLSGIFEK